MKASFVSVVVCLVAVAFTGVAFAGPTSPLYLTYYQYGQTIAVVQGNTITTFPEAYGNASYEVPIAVYGGALALDPATHTLWLVDNKTGYLYQYSTAGVLLSTGPYVGFALGGEFNLAPTPTPEPGTLVMFGSGALGLAGLLRRKINL